MKAVFVESPHHFSVVDRHDPTARAGEAIVRVEAAGLCATDLSIIDGSNPIATFPLTPGHECVGVVESTPTGSVVEVGDWVTVYPSIGCGRCRACQEGRINHCPSFKVLGLSRDGGCFAERFAVGVDQLLPVPPSLRGPQGALIEPAAVGVHVNRRAALRPGERLLVVGAGVIGTLSALVARAWGAEEICLVDRLSSRRAVCANLGFNRFLLTADGPSAERLRRDFGPVDLVYDTVCTDETVALALDALAPGGRVVLIASPKGEHALKVPFGLVYRRELTLVSSRNYVPQDFRDAIGLMDEGRIAAASLITGAYPLSEFASAVREFKDHPDRHLKILLKPQAQRP